MEGTTPHETTQTSTQASHILCSKGDELLRYLSSLLKKLMGRPVAFEISRRISTFCASGSCSVVSGASSVLSKSMFCILAHSASNKPSKLLPQHTPKFEPNQGRLSDHNASTLACGGSRIKHRTTHVNIKQTHKLSTPQTVWRSNTIEQRCQTTTTAVTRGQRGSPQVDPPHSSEAYFYY
jgi:hypothetical protein